MSKIIVFVQVHGRAGILEAELSDAVTIGELRHALEAAGVKLDAEALLFLDEADDHLTGESHDPVHGIKHGCRIHVSRCRRIKTTVHYLEQSKDRDFAPGARVRAVKEWAVDEFKLNPKDATEHVLQICKSTERPPSDTPLHQLVVAGDCHSHDKPGHAADPHCELCFDLVPDKRVEG